MTRGEILRLGLAESGLLGGIAGLLALPLGVALALVLVHVINRRAFGWSIEMAVPVRVLVDGIALAVGAALVAGLYPALRRSRVPPAAALREE
jgi:putative ABC transport system permease protein